MIAATEIKRIVIIGPESTGKSTLSKLLAAHYNTIWCEEYAREYLLKNGTNYHFDDLLTIAQGQIMLEDNGAAQLAANAKENGRNLYFIDTDMQVMKVWCEYVFGQCHPWINQQIASRKYDLYLLCNIDLPWVADELREYPDEAPRIELYHIYKTILENQSVPWVNISGNYVERLQTAIAAIDAHFSL